MGVSENVADRKTSADSTLSVPLWPFGVIRLPSAESFAARPTYTDLMTRTNELMTRS